MPWHCLTHLGRLAILFLPIPLPWSLLLILLTLLPIPSSRPVQPPRRPPHLDKLTDHHVVCTSLATPPPSNASSSQSKSSIHSSPSKLRERKFSIFPPPRQSPLNPPFLPGRDARRDSSQRQTQAIQAPPWLPPKNPSRRDPKVSPPPRIIVPTDKLETDIEIETNHDDDVESPEEDHTPVSGDSTPTSFGEPAFVFDEPRHDDSPNVSPQPPSQPAQSPNSIYSSRMTAAIEEPPTAILASVWHAGASRCSSNLTTPVPTRPSPDFSLCSDDVFGRVVSHPSSGGSPRAHRPKILRSVRSVTFDPFVSEFDPDSPVSAGGPLRRARKKFIYFVSRGRSKEIAPKASKRSLKLSLRPKTPPFSIHQSSEVTISSPDGTEWSGDGQDDDAFSTDGNASSSPWTVDTEISGEDEEERLDDAFDGCDDEADEYANDELEEQQRLSMLRLKEDFDWSLPSERNDVGRTRKISAPMAHPAFPFALSPHDDDAESRFSSPRRAPDVPTPTENAAPKFAWNRPRRRSSPTATTTTTTPPLDGSPSSLLSTLTSPGSSSSPVTPLERRHSEVAVKRTRGLLKAQSHHSLPSLLGRPTVADFDGLTPSKPDPHRLLWNIRLLRTENVAGELDDHQRHFR